MQHKKKLGGPRYKEACQLLCTTACDLSRVYGHPVDLIDAERAASRIRSKALARLIVDPKNIEYPNTVNNERVRLEFEPQAVLKFMKDNECFKEALGDIELHLAKIAEILSESNVFLFKRPIRGFYIRQLNLSGRGQFYMADYERLRVLIERLPDYTFIIHSLAAHLKR